MARAIIRWSVNGERSNQTGNEVVGRLQQAGFERVGTASYEVDGAPMRHLVAALRDALDVLERPIGGGRLDHLWVYVDNPDSI